MKWNTQLRSASFLTVIRLLMAEGKLDLTLDSQNELINPGEKYWKWKTLGSYAREVKGRPPVPNM